MMPWLAGLPVPDISADDMRKLYEAFAGVANRDVTCAAFAVSAKHPDGMIWFDPAAARLDLLVDCLSDGTVPPSSLLCAVGRIPMNYCEPVPATLVLDLAAAIANQAEEPQPTCQVIPFPIMRRLEQMHDAADDYNSFPDGPSAA